MDYIDEAFPTHTFLPPLSQSAAQLRATVRFWANHIDKTIPTGFIGILLHQDPEKQAESAKTLLTSIKEFAENGLLKSNPTGALFLPSEELSLVDIAFAPFAIRFENVLKHYRNFSVPDGPELAWKRYAKWVEAVKRHPAVAATVSDEDRYLQSYSRYADGTAQSKAAQAVRDGKTIY